MLRLASRARRPPLVTPTRSYSQTQPCHSQRPLVHSRLQGKPGSKKNTNYRKLEAPEILAENRCAIVSTWDLLRNPAEAFALIRAVEQKYGPVESFSFRKDFDSPSTYQTRINITFQSIESFNRLPRQFQTFHIRAPKVQKNRPGGIGLDEISPLLSTPPEFLSADQVSELADSEERTIDFRIQRSHTAFFTPSPFPLRIVNANYRKAVGSKMLQWGGFHPMQPISSKQPITNEDLTNETIDHVHMRRALRKWARFCGEKNPYEFGPEQEEEEEEEEVTKTISTALLEEEAENQHSKYELEKWALDDQQPCVPWNEPTIILQHPLANTASDSILSSTLPYHTTSPVSSLTAGPSIISKSDILEHDKPRTSSLVPDPNFTTPLPPTLPEHNPSERRVSAIEAEAQLQDVRERKTSTTSLGLPESKVGKRRTRRNSVKTIEVGNKEAEA